MQSVQMQYQEALDKANAADQQMQAAMEMQEAAAVSDPVHSASEPVQSPVPREEKKRPQKPVKKIERAGCVFWQVELKKTHPSESYGFTQISGKEWKLDVEDGPEHWLVKRIVYPGLLGQWNQ